MNHQEIEKQEIHRLQIYCEQQVKRGTIVAERYNAEWMDDCWAYIKEQVRKDMESASSVQMVWHTQIYRLARDYFNDNLHESRANEKAEKEAKKAASEAKKKEAAEKKRLAAKKKAEKSHINDSCNDPVKPKETKTDSEQEIRPEPGQLDFLALLGA